MNIYRTFSSAETKKLGNKIAKFLRHGTRDMGHRKDALVFALQGDLGAGKTTFTQGFLSGLGIRKRSGSPTFIIFRKFIVHSAWYQSVYHVDAYRLKKPRELAVLGFKEMLSNPRNIVLIEWAENIKSVLPKGTIWLRFAHGKNENERILKSSIKWPHRFLV